MMVACQPMFGEFQDTSPIQLALFAKLSFARLSDLADKTLFESDIKQAICGFGGTVSTPILDVLKLCPKWP
ncbi:hypothetical protein [Endozoicomonas sp. ONNA1]|uniref:hypothetical protein n=1 Tax=Endozoicomonas sp. ONNA1 TaxID=2828740 RepID=UPI002147F838|nr:hypothetical protein [Endozoicomonas sp. ONNA1]